METTSPSPAATPAAPPPPAATDADPAGTLASLTPGKRALVCRVTGAPAVSRRLMEMGLLPGTEVTYVRPSALGDPREYQVRGYRLSLRRAQAAEVETIEVGADLPPPPPPGTRAAPPPRAEGSRPEAPRVLIAGNPNAGKTTVFNALTGSSARVGNYPGVTVERKVGRLARPDGDLELIDLPGTYSLSARSEEERVAVHALLGRDDPPPHAVLVVVDSGVLARSMYLVTQVLETGIPVVVGLNMMDEAAAAGREIDPATLASRFGCEFVPLTASKGEGLDALGDALDRAVRREVAPAVFPLELPAAAADALAGCDAAAGAEPGTTTPAATRALARWAVLSLAGDDMPDTAPALREAATAAREAAAAAGLDLAAEVIQARYRWIESGLAGAADPPPAPEGTSWQDRIDGLLTHKLFGSLVFAGTMLAIFALIYRGCDPLIGAVEGGVAWAQDAARAALPAGFVADLVSEGIVAGVGNILVFVPQIAALFVVLGFLEDCGYLARVAFLIDRVMGGVGLHGKAFVPMLSGFACAIPAAMATRTIENRLDRILTMITLPLMSCGARLPVYVLMIAVVFPSQDPVFLGLGMGPWVLMGMYALSVAATLAAAALLRRTVLKGPRPALVLELPPYRWPVLRNLLTATWQRLRKFLVDAGTIILALTIMMWVLLSYPRRPDLDAELAAKTAAIRRDLPAEARPDALAAIEGEISRAKLESSYAGRLGKAIEPVFRPLGMDWRVSIGVIGSFAAREVFVSTMGVVFGIQEADEESKPLREHLEKATWPDGRPLFTRASGLALMVFFVLAAQCMSTVAVVKREAESWNWAIFMVAMMTGMAYVGALVVYQVGSRIGL